jgi:hypothetical protein
MGSPVRAGAPLKDTQLDMVSGGCVADGCCTGVALCAGPINEQFFDPPPLPVQNSLASSLFGTGSMTLSAWVTAIFGSHGLTPFGTP